MIQGREKVMIRLLFNQRAKKGCDENVVYRLRDKNGFEISLTQCFVKILSMNILIITRHLKQVIFENISTNIIHILLMPIQSIQTTETLR